MPAPPRRRCDDLDLVAEVTGSVLAAALAAAVEHRGRQGRVGDLGAIVAAGLELIRSGTVPLSDPAGSSVQADQR
jgi:hypothetical protein